MDMLNGKIRVYNYELSPVGFPSQHIHQGVFIRGRDEDEEFVVERVFLDDIEIENSKSDIFKVGRLRFHPDEEDEIYLKLGIEDKENILSDKELADLLLDDSIENIKRISKIKSHTLISRMKSTLFSLERGGRIPPHRISAAVIERAHELLNGKKRDANSEINKILESEKKAVEESKLRETLREMQEQISNLQRESKEKDEKVKSQEETIAKSQEAIEQLLQEVKRLTEKNNATTSSKKGATKTTSNAPSKK